MYHMMKITAGMAYDEEDDLYIVYTKDDDYYSVTPEVYDELERADGVHPLNLSKEVICELETCGIITASHLEHDGLISYCTLFLIGPRAKAFYKVSVVLNKLLPYLSLIMLFAGIILRIICPLRMETYYPSLNVYAFVLSVVLTLALHEFAHFNAANAYHLTVSQAGLLFVGFFPIGAFVAIEDDDGYDEESRLKCKQRVQMMLAGIEMHVLLVGLMMIIQSLVPSSFYITLVIAVLNTAMAIVNLLPAFQNDGERALSALFDVPSVSHFAFKPFYDKKYLHKLLHSGSLGYVTMGLFGLIYLSHLVVIGIVGLSYFSWMISLFDGI